MAVSTQDIIDFLLANPGMSDADIGSAMATYGVSPEQMAKATGLSEGEVTSRLAATLPNNQATLFGDTYVQPIYTQIGAGEGYQQGPLENIVTYKASDNKTGGAYQQYTPTGELERTGTQQAVPSFTEGLAPVLQAVLLASGAGGALGGALGLTGAAAQGVGTGLITGGSTALAGGSGSDILKAGLLGGGGAYLGNTISDILASNTPIDASNMTQAQFNDSLEGQLVKNMQNAGLTKDQITAFLDDMGIGQGLTSTAPTAVSTPVTDAGGVTVTAPTTTALNAGMLGSLVTPSTVANAGTVNVTGQSTPQQVDQAVIDLINNQIQQTTTSSKTATTPTQTITANKPVTTTQDIVSAITAAIPTVTPTQAATIAEQVITSGKPVTTQEVINAITATLPSVITPTTTTTVPNVTVTAQKPTTVGDTLATFPATLVNTPTTTTPATTTTDNQDNPLGLTNDQILNILKGGIGLLGGLGAGSLISGGGTSTVNPSGLPTQAPPMYTGDYFTKVQQNYNQLLPAVPRDVATPLRDWYLSQYGA